MISPLRAEECLMAFTTSPPIQEMKASSTVYSHAVTSGAECDSH